jgi:hypothetical protein
MRHRPGEHATGSSARPAGCKTPEVARPRLCYPTGGCSRHYLHRRPHPPHADPDTADQDHFTCCFSGSWVARRGGRRDFVGGAGMRRLTLAATANALSRAKAKSATTSGCRLHSRCRQESALAAVDRQAFGLGLSALLGRAARRPSASRSSASSRSASLALWPWTSRTCLNCLARPLFMPARSRAPASWSRRRSRAASAGVTSS